MIFDVFKINSLETKQKYMTLLSSIENSDPYYLLDYIEVFCGGLNNLICLSYHNPINNNRAVMTGYLNPIIISYEETPFFDFITPYGYTGPIFSSNIIDSDIIEFWRHVDEWYANNYVIAEFVRFNLSNNHKYYSGDAFPTMLNIKGKIIDKENQWLSFDRKVRKNVNKAIRENLTSEIYYLNIEYEKISEFYDIYIETMKRTNASEKFFYAFDKFTHFINNNEQSCAICTIYLEETPVSSELILISNDSVYSFLGGTKEEYFDKRPNDFLKVEIINWARQLNKNYYVLGGGFGMEDGIFKYKRSFFKNDVVKYYTGRKVIDSIIYKELIEKVNIIRANNDLHRLEIEDTSFFPLYRKYD